VEYSHIPVMVQEVLHYIDPAPKKTYVDCTLGGGGHAGAILERILPGGTLFAIDQDPDAISHARAIFHHFEPCIRLFHDNFCELPRILKEQNTSGVDGILLDLGVSSHHIEGSGRGFSFLRDEPLDMRMDFSDQVPTAADIVNGASERELADIFFRYGEERWARRIAGRIVRERRKRAIRTSLQLASLVQGAVPHGRERQRIHPATRVFQALRIAVNRELESLGTFLQEVPACLNRGGRLCILSFHSLEDRLVKRWLKQVGRGCTCPVRFPRCVCGQKPVVQSLTPRAVRPSPEEALHNPRARSARLRAAQKL